MGAGRKRPRGDGELARVAEMVMVLAAAGETRGGLSPTTAERALAAEARGKLAAAVEEAEVRPRDLVPREAVCALVEDLGLGRSRDPAAVGYRRPRASIAERVLLTKRKMEEVKEAPVQSRTNIPKTTASSTITGFQHGTSKSNGSPRNLSTPMTSPVISKHPLPNGTIAGASYVKPAIVPSIVSLLPVSSADVRVGQDVNGSHVTQNGGAATIDLAKKSYHHTATGANQNSVQSSHQAGKSLDKNAPASHTWRGSIVTGHQTPSRELSVHKQSIFTNHKAIANKVEWILYQSCNHPSWTVPSSEFMNSPFGCQICKVPVANMESLLVCDACERGMHLKCLQHYGNQDLIKTEWYCPSCVAQSKGRLLPPKYGKVARTFVAPKTSTTSGASATQSSSQVAAESATKEDSSKKVAANESAIDENSNAVGSTVHKSSTLGLNTTSSKSLSISGAGPQKEDVKLAETSSMQKERNGQPCGGILTETAKSCNERQSSGTSTHGSSNLSGGPHMNIESSTLQSTALSGFKDSNHSLVVSSKENCEGDRTSYQHPSKNVQRASSTTPTDEIRQTDKVAYDAIRKPRQQEILTDGAISDHGNAFQVTSNGHICPDHAIMGDVKDGYVGCSTASIVDWVGDALEAVDDKTYYNSFNIDGVIYNLHDHVLIALGGRKPGPCKLESLWEEHDSGSRLAMVNPYFFHSDIPESISKPCTDEDDEVYGSNDQRIVLVNTICGPCEVLHVDKFSEETKRRCQLDTSGSRLHPIFFCRWNLETTSCRNAGKGCVQKTQVVGPFPGPCASGSYVYRAAPLFCRWKYDESTSSFYKDYNVDN